MAPESIGLTAAARLRGTVVMLAAAGRSSGETMAMMYEVRVGTRAGILSGAASCVARYGTRKTTMGDIAREGGVAKATLYNHFRTKDDVLAALLASQVDELVDPLRRRRRAAGHGAGADVGARHGRGVRLRAPGAAAPRRRRAGAGRIAHHAGHGRAVGARAHRRSRAHLPLALAAGTLHARHDTEALVDASRRAGSSPTPSGPPTPPPSTKRPTASSAASSPNPSSSSSSVRPGETRDEGDLPNFRSA